MTNEHALVVDLDGSLIKTDLLYETFWKAVSTRGPAALGSLMHLKQSRASFKSHLADTTDIDVSQLPVNQDVLDYIQERRQAGDPVILCSASDERLVRQVADHLGCFDEAYGSDALRNLKGPEKATFLVEKYGDGGFDYIGDSDADMAVWRHARQIITVGLSDSKRTAVDGLGKQTTHLNPNLNRTSETIRAMRPYQWSKNVLIFLPIIAAHNITASSLMLSVLAFVAFSMIASGVYVLNDLLDLSSDRPHPRKSSRPLASGSMSIVRASLLAPCLFMAGGLVAVATWSPAFVMILLIYFGLTTSYSLWLKRMMLVDIFMLAGLYITRIIAGGLATGVPISEWLLTFAGFFFIALAAVKRQAELVDGAQNGRERIMGRAYKVADLPVVMGIAVASGFVSILVLALYVNSDAVRVLYDAPVALFAICPVLLFWISRMIMVAHRGNMDDDPIVFAFKDRTSHVCGILVVAIVLTSGIL